MTNRHTAKSRIAKNTMLLYVRQLFVLVLALYTSRLTLQVLGESDFGVYVAVGGLTALLSIITSSMSSSTQRFMTFELGRKNFDRLNLIYVTSVQIHTILSVVFVLFAEVLGLYFIYYHMVLPHDRLDVTFWVFQFSIINCVLGLINIPNNAAIIAHEDMGVFSLFSILDALLKITVVICLSYISWDKLLFYAFFLLVIQIINRTIAIVWCHIKYAECHYIHKVDKVLIRQMFNFAGWDGLMNLSVSGFIQGVNILLNVFFGPAMNAAYSVAMQAYSGIRSFCSNFQLASNPQIVKLYSEGNNDEMVKLVYMVCKISFFLIFALSLPFLLNANYILGLWLVQVPEHTTVFFCILLIYAYINVWVYPLDVCAKATGKLKRYSLIVSLITIVPLPLAFILYHFVAIPEIIYYIAIFSSFCGIIAQINCLRPLIGIKVSSFMYKVVFNCCFTAAIAIIIPYSFSYISTTSLFDIFLSFFISIASSIISI